MPHRVSDRGSYRFDLVFPQIGRIALASGARTSKEHGKRVAMLRELYDNGQWDVLRDLKARRFSPRQLYAYYRTGRVGQLGAEVVLRQPLKAAIETWLPVSGKSDATRLRYGKSWKSLERSGVLAPDAIVRDLERVNWIELQRTWKGGPYDWRQLRGVISRFLTMLLRDRWHAFRRSIIHPESFPRGPEPEARVPDLTPEAFWRIVAEMPEHTRPAPVALLATAMRDGELAACTEASLLPLTQSVLIPGKELQSGEFKSQQATQPVHPELWAWVRAAIPLPVSIWTLREHWRIARKKAGVPHVTLHDLRHCYAQWLVSDGRSEESVQRGLRHKTPSMTRRYAMQKDRRANALVIGEVLLKSHGESHGGKRKRGRKRA